MAGSPFGYHKYLYDVTVRTEFGVEDTQRVIATNIIAAHNIALAELRKGYASSILTVTSITLVES